MPTFSYGSSGSVAAAPAYAIPKDFVVCPAAEARRIGLLTANGRVQRKAAKKAFAELKLAQIAA